MHRDPLATLSARTAILLTRVTGATTRRYHLGLLDTAFLLPYAVVQLFLGHVGDVLGPRRALAACLAGAAVSMATFGAWTTLPPLLLLLVLNGAFQSLCAFALQNSPHSLLRARGIN